MNRYILAAVAAHVERHGSPNPAEIERLIARGCDNLDQAIYCLCSHLMESERDEDEWEEAGLMWYERLRLGTDEEISESWPGVVAQYRMAEEAMRHDQREES